MATPTVAAIRRCGSRVAASDMTTNVTWPGSRRFMPCERERMRHLGGKMLETRTRLHAAMTAERSASSNEVSFSRCFPTPLVKNISLGTNPTTLLLLVEGEVHGKHHGLVGQVGHVGRVGDSPDQPDRPAPPDLVEPCRRRLRL